MSHHEQQGTPRSWTEMQRSAPFDPWTSMVAAADVMAATNDTAAGLAGRQASRLSSLLASASRRSPLYRRVLGEFDPASVQLRDLPVMRKKDLMREFADWVTDPGLRLDALQQFTADPSRIGSTYRGRYVVWESSGSTGEPAIFVQDAAAMAVCDALEACRRPMLRPLQRMVDPWCLGERAAFVGAIGGHFASVVSLQRLRRLNSVLSQRLRLFSFLQPMPQLVAQLNAWVPTVIATYPSVAVLLAGERRAGRLGFAPQEVWTGGEALLPAERRLAEQAFGCPLVNSYGASEFLSLACECRCGRLHLNSDWAILESVDERGREVPPDSPGATTLLTNLANHVQPLIRYDLGDRVTFRSQACRCGSHLPVIEVQGRSDDTLRLGPERSAVSIPPLALCTVLEDDAGMFDFQLIQEGPSELVLRTPLRGEAATDVLRRAQAALRAFLRGQGVGEVHIHCAGGWPSARGRSGKVQRVVSKVE
jgi:phenylacetate-coenzyme A ligase PaaK-like adenylate-forming protein